MYLSIFHDHDLRVNNRTAVPNFFRASLVFPFIDRLRNNRSSFRYGGIILVSVNQVVEVNEPKLQRTVIGSFEPACDAYAADEEGEEGRVYVKAWSGDGEREEGRTSFDVRVRPIVGEPTYSFDA